MQRRIRSFVPVTLILAAYLAVTATNGSGHPADPSKGIAPHWSCRASAAYVNLVGSAGSGHVEPLVANGDAMFGNDADQCQSDGSGFPQPSPIQGGDPSQGTFVEDAPFAQTKLCSTSDTSKCVRG